MADVKDIIDYIKSLRKGFDKDLFQRKLEELAYIVDSVGFDYDSFYTLFKVWLNLSIPITKWRYLGCCLVPREVIEERTIQYAQRWILANFDSDTNFSRIAFLLDWLTAALDNESIDVTALDSAYEIFYAMLSYEVLTGPCLKLVYVLTKPGDVTRRRVLQLLDLAKKRENKKNLVRQIHVLLGLFKSYKPECVPEHIPAVSIHSSFNKINEVLLKRFKNHQERHSPCNKQHLMWMNPLNLIIGKNKKADPLVPNMAFLHSCSNDSNGRRPQKNYLDFTEAAPLVRWAASEASTRPARLRALLAGGARGAGLTLLVLQPQYHPDLLHDLCHVLTAYFLESSPHSYAEKADFLHRLAELQSTVMQGVTVVTNFLAQYLPLWNERDYFKEILELVEWVDVASPEQVMYIVRPLTRIYHRAQPLEQCAILRSLTNMYVNLVYTCTRKIYYFIGVKPRKTIYNEILPQIAQSISEMCNLALQVNPDDFRVLWSGVRSAKRMVSLPAFPAAPACPAPAPALTPAPLLLALPLVGSSAALLDDVAALIIMYKQLLKSNKSQDESYTAHVNFLKNYASDTIRCLVGDDVIRSRDSGVIFSTLQPQVVQKLCWSVPNADFTFNIKNHVAFLSYMRVWLGGECHLETDNKIWFDSIINQEFTNLSHFLKKAISALR